MQLPTVFRASLHSLVQFIIDYPMGVGKATKYENRSLECFRNKIEYKTVDK